MQFFQISLSALHNTIVPCRQVFRVQQTAPKIEKKQCPFPTDIVTAQRTYKTPLPVPYHVVVVSLLSAPINPKVLFSSATATSEASLLTSRLDFPSSISGQNVSNLSKSSSSLQLHSSEPRWVSRSSLVLQLSLPQKVSQRPVPLCTAPALPSRAAAGLVLIGRA